MFRSVYLINKPFPDWQELEASTPITFDMGRENSFHRTYSNLAECRGWRRDRTYSRPMQRNEDISRRLCCLCLRGKKRRGNGKNSWFLYLILSLSLSSSLTSSRSDSRSFSGCNKQGSKKNIMWFEECSLRRCSCLQKYTARTSMFETKHSFLTSSISLPLSAAGNAWHEITMRASKIAKQLL